MSCILSLPLFPPNPQWSRPAPHEYPAASARLTPKMISFFGPRNRTGSNWHCSSTDAETHAGATDVASRLADPAKAFHLRSAVPSKQGTLR